MSWWDNLYQGSWLESAYNWADNSYDGSWLESAFGDGDNSSTGGLVSSPQLPPTPEVVDSHYVDPTTNLSSSGWSWGDYLTPKNVLGAGSGILGYLNKKEQLDYERKRTDKKDELDRLMAIAELESKKLNLMRAGVGRGGGGGGNSKMEVLTALNNGAALRLNALNSLVSNYSYAVKGGR